MTRLGANRRHLLLAIALVVAAAPLAWILARSAVGQVRTPRITVAIPWAGRGTWMAVDLHTHTRFSDGSQQPAEVVDRGLHNGCSAIGITDHSDRDLRAATPEYQAAMLAVRQAHPEVVLPAGVEWNVPPWGGDEHAVVLLPPGPAEWAVLTEFKRRFDDLNRDVHDPALAAGALRWLAANGSVGGVAPVVIDAHPSRKKAPVDSVTAMAGWKDINDLVIGFEGAPGHQRTAPVIGSYRAELPTIDRWDPVVAEIGGAWDRLIQRGLTVWGAIASSDFHNDSASDLHDYWPCEFAETWVYAPDRTTAGLLRALRAGAFFAAHGHIARDVNLAVAAPGLERAAMAGETLAVAVGTTLTVTLALDVPPVDWEGQPNHIDAIELIAISASGATLVASRSPVSGSPAFTELVPVPKGGVVLRARGRRTVPGGPDLLFYTNPVRVTTGSPRD